jgi:hypothetical protein
VKRSYGVIDDGQHSPSIGRDDSSVSSAWRPFCSCGWSGIAIISPIEIEDFQEVFQKFAKEHGADSVLPADAIFGNENDALIQVLQHIWYDSEDDERFTVGELDAAVVALKNYNVRSDGTQGLYDLTSEFPRIIEAVADQKHRAFVWSTVASPTLRENAAEVELALRQHLVDVWESQKRA